jgi:hypothetical protein
VFKFRGCSYQRIGDEGIEDGVDILLVRCVHVDIKSSGRCQEQCNNSASASKHITPTHPGQNTSTDLEIKLPGDIL